MIIECSNCKRKYRLEDSRITPPGSSVRCSKCGHIFFISKKEVSQRKETAQKTPLFEDLEEEVIDEVTIDPPEALNDENNAEPLQSQSENTEQSPSRFDSQKEAQENELDHLDIPTEHQIDLEEYIDQKISEQQSEEASAGQLIEEEVIEEKSEPEQDDEVIEESPELFDDSDIELDEETETEKVGEAVENNNKETFFEEKFNDNDNDQESETATSETIEVQDNVEDTNSRQLTKASSSMLARFFYTLITLAAIFVIFTSSVVILINAEILPKGTLSGLTNFVEAILPIDISTTEAPVIIITEHNERWMNTINGPVYIVSGLITNKSENPVHYVKLKSVYIAGEKELYQDTFYAGNTFTDRELKASPIENILSKLDQKNGDIDVNNSNKLAGLNYNIQPGESIPFFTVFPSEGRVLGLRYNLEVIDYDDRPTN